MRKIFVFFMLITAAVIFADQSTDGVTATPKFKFRGNISFVADYMTEYQDGVNEWNNYKSVNYDKLDYTDDNHKTAGDSGRYIGGSWGGAQAKLYASYSAIMPFLNFDTPLTKDNNIKFTLNYEISPITMNGGGSVTITPAAFLLINTGFLIGPGWQINSTLAGIGINNHGNIERYNFAGPLFQQWFSFTFQMDTAFLLPERLQRWTHFVVLSTTTFKYQQLLGVDINQPYMYEECPGEQLGGWRLISDFLVGYRFYIREDKELDKNMFINHNTDNFIVTIGFYGWLDYLDLTHYNDSPMKNGWGSDFAFFNFGPAVQVDLPRNFYFKLFAFFRNDRAYTDETAGNLYYQDRKYEDYYIFFRWFGGFIGWNF